MKIFLIFTLWVSAIFAQSPALTKKISLGTELLDVEIANTPETRGKGLMGRMELEDGQGMLFVFDRPEFLSFWMKNTFIHLSIAFFDKDQILINMADMPPDVLGGHPASAFSHAPALYALEVPLGWFEKHHIERGMKFAFRRTIPGRE